MFAFPQYSAARWGGGRTDLRIRFEESEDGVIRLERLEDDRLARELEELLVLTGIAEIPDKNSNPPGLPSGRRNEPPEAPLDAELEARIERAVADLGGCIGLLRDDLAGLEMARRRLRELLEQRGRG